MKIAGDAEGCSQLATTLRQAAAGVERARVLQQSAQTAVGSWEGSAAHAFADAARAHQSTTSQLTKALHAAAQALASFAEGLRQAQALAARAEQVALDASLVIGADGSIAPVTLTLDLSASDEEGRRAAFAHGLVQEHARGEALRLLKVAVETEGTAHDNLRVALEVLLVPPLVGALLGSRTRHPGLGGPLPGRLSPPSDSLFGDYPSNTPRPWRSPTPMLEPRPSRAPAPGGSALSWPSLAPEPTDPVDALSLAGRTPAQMHARADKLLAAGQGNVRRLQGTRVATELTDSMWGRLPDGMGIGRSVGVAGVALTIAEVAVESNDDAVGPERAVTKAVATTAAGSVGYAGGLALAGGLGMTGVGAPVAVGIVAAIAVSWGVGKVVDQWREDHPRDRRTAR